jgi:hypothetical protein
MERFFRSLKNEWVPATGYVSFSDAALLNNELKGSDTQFRGSAPTGPPEQRWLLSGWMMRIQA